MFKETNSHSGTGDHKSVQGSLGLSVRKNIHKTPGSARKFLWLVVHVVLLSGDKHKRVLIILNWWFDFQRKFIKEEPIQSKESGKLYDNFKTWTRLRYGREPTTVQWSTILQEDKETCWGETISQLEQSQQSSILAPDTPNGSQSTTVSQQTQYSPLLL